MSVCTTAMPFLSSLWTWVGLAGLGVGAKVAYSYSSLSFWPSFLALSSIVRILGGVSSILNLLWRANIFVFAALLTTFNDSLTLALEGQKWSLKQLLVSLGSDIYFKVGFAVQHLGDGLTHLAEWLQVLTGKGLCSALGSLEILWLSITSFWVGLAAYIFAVRIYDWIYGKGMTREIEYPELLMVIAVVTLASVIVVGTSSVVQALSSGELVVEALGSVFNISS